MTAGLVAAATEIVNFAVCVSLLNVKNGESYILRANGLVV